MVETELIAIQLIEAGCPVDSLDSQGFTPLDWLEIQWASKRSSSDSGLLMRLKERMCRLSTRRSIYICQSCWRLSPPGLKPKHSCYYHPLPPSIYHPFSHSTGCCDIQIYRWTIEETAICQELFMWLGGCEQKEHRWA